MDTLTCPHCAEKGHPSVFSRELWGVADGIGLLCPYAGHLVVFEA